MRSIAPGIFILLPDRLPSLVVLDGFWIPPAVAGWLAAEFLQRSTRRAPARLTVIALAIFVVGYAATWFFFNLGRMPPYIPGASTDPTFAPPRAVAGLAVVASRLVLPGSVLVCALAYRLRKRMLTRMSTSSVSAYDNLMDVICPERALRNKAVGSQGQRASSLLFFVATA